LPPWAMAAGRAIPSWATAVWLAAVGHGDVKSAKFSNCCIFLQKDYIYIYIIPLSLKKRTKPNMGPNGAWLAPNLPSQN
jgi:hypothetical protein